MRFKSLLLLLLLPLINCGSPEIYPQGELADQILVARHGHEGSLTNQTCLAYDHDKCVKESLITYDLSNQSFRDTARRLQFVCKMGGKEYKICPDKPGFCRTTDPCNWFSSTFQGCEKQIEYVPASPTQLLIDGRIRCFSRSKYDWDAIP